MDVKRKGVDQDTDVSTVTMSYTRSACLVNIPFPLRFSQDPPLNFVINHPRHIQGYLYACNARNLALHPCCSNLKANLCIGGMDFILHNKVSSSSKCKRCNQKTPLGTKTGNPGCSYVSTCSKYHFHVYCITQMVHVAWTNGDID
ncbi:hypothetical protein ACSBR1_007647 [Camellia fascicularis]